MVSLAELLVGKGINGHFDLGFGLVACTIKLQSWNVHVSNGCRVSLNTPGVDRVAQLLCELNMM